MCDHNFAVIFGLVGGVGCGKSLVASLFREFGAEVVDADVIGHGLLCELEVQVLVRECFGDSVFCEVGGVSCVDRRELARRVFTPTELGQKELALLNSILHPRITKIIEAQMKSFKESGGKVLVLDVPLLLEAGMRGVVDRVVFVEASRENRIRRVSKRNWTETELNRREATQLPINEKQQQADFTINNNGTIDETRDQVKTLYTTHYGFR
ncbi:MAG: dephospho-CoA kinase [Planctomycetaceae bacterium]|nr:dephospho-CoA kinase [Planctomycetaceae bacterium]